MRILIPLIMLVLIISCRNGDKSNSDPVSSSRSETVDTAEASITSSDTPRVLKNVEDIKEEYEYVASKIRNKGMDSTSFTYNCRDEKNGTVVYYFDNDILRMIKHTYDEYSHFSATDSYFVRDGAMFFVYFNRVSWSFDSQVQGESQTKDNITESRFYIIDNKPVKCLEKKFTIRSSSTDNPTSDIVSNKEITCPSLKPILQKFELLAKYRNQEKSMACLEE